MTGTKIKNHERESFFSPTLFTQMFAFKEFSALRLIVGSISPCLIGLGVGISIPLQLGSFTFGAFFEGLLETFGIALWLSNLLLAFSLYFLAWFIGRIMLGVGTLPTIFLISPAIEIGAAIVPEDTPIVARLIILSISLAIFGLGILLSAAAALGPEPVSALCLAFESRYGWSISRSIFAMNLAATTLGFLLGGTIMAATVVSLFTPALFLALGLTKTRALLGVKAEN